MSRQDLIEEVRYWRREHVLDLAKAEVAAVRARFGLTPREAEITMLLANSGGLVTHAKLARSFEPEGVDKNGVDVLICRINKKLGKVIENVWGAGFKLNSRGESLFA